MNRLIVRYKHQLGHEYENDHNNNILYLIIYICD